MENKLETAICAFKNGCSKKEHPIMGYIGGMEKTMESTIQGFASILFFYAKSLVSKRAEGLAFCRQVGCKGHLGLGPRQHSNVIGALMQLALLPVIPVSGGGLA